MSISTSNSVSYMCIQLAMREACKYIEAKLATKVKYLHLTFPQASSFKATVISHFVCVIHLWLEQDSNLTQEFVLLLAHH